MSIHDYALLHGDGRRDDLGRATWCDWDRGGRLLLARDGKVVDWLAPGDTREIADFNAAVPDHAPAPARARQWPR